LRSGPRRRTSGLHSRRRRQRKNQSRSHVSDDH